MTPRRLAPALAAVAGCAAIAALARADWLQPDAAWREAQIEVRLAARDTVDHAGDPGRLDTLAVALLRMDRLPEAAALFSRALALKPGDPAACAGLGKLALFDDRLDEADSLLARAASLPEALPDRYWTKLRLGRWREAAALTDDANDAGRAPLLERLADGAWWTPGGAPARTPLYLERGWPAPLVKVRLGGTVVVMAIDTGAPGLIVDPATLRANGVQAIPGQRVMAWDGARVAVGNAVVPTLAIGGLTLSQVPAAVLSLHKYSVDVNPQGEFVMGVIGLDVLRRFDVTLDLEHNRLVIAPPGTTPVPAGARVPFQLWGEGELMVRGSLNGGRRMAMQLATGLEACGVAAPAAVLEEVGVRPGAISRFVRGPGPWLMGHPWSAVTVPTVTVGAVAADRQPGWSGALDPVEMERHGVRRDALLGPAFLRGRRVTFDWKGHALVVE